MESLLKDANGLKEGVNQLNVFSPNDHMFLCTPKYWSRGIGDSFGTSSLI